jgi:uncharacterized membrane protein YkvA (DUF1232 family)
MAFEKSKEIARSLKRELIVYQRVLRDERTPLSAKLFLALAIGYLCMPFDLIPDFIPVIGHLDDAIIVPALVCCPSLSAARNRFRAPRAGRPRTEFRATAKQLRIGGQDKKARTGPGVIPLPKCRMIRHNSRSAASLYDAITHIPSIPVPAALCFERLRPSRRLHRRDVGFRHP